MINSWLIIIHHHLLTWGNRKNGKKRRQKRREVVNSMTILKLLLQIKNLEEEKIYILKGQQYSYKYNKEDPYSPSREGEYRRDKY